MPPKTAQIHNNEHYVRKKAEGILVPLFFFLDLTWIASSKKFILKSNWERTILLVTVIRILEEQYAIMLMVAELANELWDAVAVIFCLLSVGGRKEGDDKVRDGSGCPCFCVGC